AWGMRADRGLGTRYVDTTGRAVRGGLSRATPRSLFVGAVLEGIGWRCREVYDALRPDAPFPPPASLRVDGGAARNDVLLQLQADALGLPGERPTGVQAGALGAAYLAGLANGVASGTAERTRCRRRGRAFEPQVG